MNTPILLAGVEQDKDGRWSVLSPEVGWWSEIPHPGALLGGGSAVGRLGRLNRSSVLVLPAGPAGRIVEGLPRARVIPVEFGQVLFRLAPLADEQASAVIDGQPLGGPAAVAGLPPGTRAVICPTDGVFYARPSPTEPPFVEPGSRVREGQTIGLVEVMKTFNRIVYGGPGLPEEAEVVEIRVEDTGEVRAGQVLMVTR